MKRFAVLSVLTMLCLLGTGVVAAQQTSDTVVATHYPEFGGTAPAPTEAFPIAYTVYNNREDDYYAVSRVRAEIVLDRIERETGVSVVMLNDWADVTEGSEALQIINNVPVEGALYTIFLPPGWTRAAQMPIVLSGNGATISNNKRLYQVGEIEPAQIAASSMQNGRSGLIVAISNCGGTESQGIDEVTLRSVGAFFDFMAANGGDKHRTVTAGGSRGGGTALMWAINPLGLDYTVKAVFAMVPPTHYGSLSQVSLLTYPAMASINTALSHDAESWRYDESGMPFHQNASYLETLIGTADPAAADALSPIGRAEALAGKQVVLAAGAHDSYFPLSHFLEFDRRLTELDIHHTTIVTLAQGHESSDYWMELFWLYVNGLSLGLEPQVPVGRYYFIDVSPARDEQLSLHDFFEQRGITDDPTELPFIMQFPYRVGVGNPVDGEVCGTPGDAFAIMLQDEMGETVYNQHYVIDESECLTYHEVVNVEPGTYVWSVLLNGEEINPRNTPARSSDGCGMQAVTIVEAEQPHPRETIAFDDAMSFGLDEYSGQPERCLLP